MYNMGRKRRMSKRLSKRLSKRMSQYKRLAKKMSKKTLAKRRKSWRVKRSKRNIGGKLFSNRRRM